MAEVPLPTPTDNAVPSTDIRDAVYAGAMLDKVVTSTELKYTDRLGGEHYTVDGIKAEGDKVVEETRQNLIPLSRQYMTLADAQADIANIPSGSTTYVRSQDGSSLADEYINNGGTLTATGRKMPSGAAIELMSDTVQRLMTALHVMAEGGENAGSGIESSDTVQNLMTGFNVLAESINNLSAENRKNSSGLSGLVSSVQICTEMLNTLASKVITPDGASQYGYAAFSVPGTVSASNGSFGTDTRYRRTGMIPVRKGDVVRLTVYTTSATAGHAAALYDSSGAYVGPLGIMCASYAAYQARYYQCEISQDGFVVANTLDQSASSSVDVTGAVPDD
ncbi:hypothetical protein [Klebsiella pneumoniae]|uniref:hypothetical protein n=1 Tax=Klebsiella pneumoniae TaxID=573 RepID=UPI003970E6C1